MSEIELKLSREEFEALKALIEVADPGADEDINTQYPGIASLMGKINAAVTALED